MDILFIHGNYPAQFRHLCAGFGANPNHRTVFLTARPDAAEDQLPGVQIEIFEQHRSVSSNTHHYLHATEEAVLRGQAVLRSLDRLFQQGFSPNLVIFHGGMGLGLFLREVLPQSVLIGYFEWWFTAETSKNLLENFDLNMQLSSSLRNLPTHHELERCNAGVVPTKWQQQQFPEQLQTKLKVIFDGIDTDFFHPAEKSIVDIDLSLTNRDTKEEFRFDSSAKILSYATRGMEPLRGFPEFMRALPYAFKEVDNLQVVIAGADRCAYSYQAPSHEGSWKNALLDEIKDKIPNQQIHFTGLLNYKDYRSLLWRSNLHCYFTKPYVTSWSLFEACSCGAKLLISTGKATDNIANPATITKVNLEDQNSINNAIIHSLTRGTSPAIIEPGYDLKSNLKKWEDLINLHLKNV